MLPGPVVTSWGVLLLEAFVSLRGVWRGALRNMDCGTATSYLV